VVEKVKFDGVEWLERKGFSVSTWKRKMELTERNLRDKVVLDAGCGAGFETNYFSQLAKQIHGIDVSKRDIEEARNKYSARNLFFQLGNVERIPYGDSTFDVVYSNWVIEHLENPKIFLDEAHRVIKPGGILILWAPNVNSIEGFIIKIFPYSLKVPILKILQQRADVSDLKCYYRANSIRKLDRFCKGKFERIYLERHDHISYYRYSRILSYFWLLKHKLLNNNLLNWMLSNFYVEYIKCSMLL